jgi:hypothetical protein
MPGSGRGIEAQRRRAGRGRLARHLAEATARTRGNIGVWLEFLHVGAKGRAAVVDRGDHRAHRHPEIDENGLAQLQARLDRLGRDVAGAQLVELGGVARVARPRNDQKMGAQRAPDADDGLELRGGIHRRHQSAHRLDADMLQHGGV